MSPLHIAWPSSSLPTTTGPLLPETMTSHDPLFRLGAFLPGGGQHIAAWRHPDSPADVAANFDFQVKLAKEAERGLFDADFLADG